jgi:ABC-type Fe3+-siderophore transport system permease subunit
MGLGASGLILAVLLIERFGLSSSWWHQPWERLVVVLFFGSAGALLLVLTKRRRFCQAATPTQLLLCGAMWAFVLGLSIGFLVLLDYR